MFTDDQLYYHAAKGGWPTNALAAELLRVREQSEETDRLRNVAAGNVIEKVKAERDALRTAMTAALRELSVPTISYPAPAANAIEILEAALEGEGDGE